MSSDIFKAIMKNKQLMQQINTVNKIEIQGIKKLKIREKNILFIV